MQIKIGKRIIKTVITLFIILLIYIALLWVDTLVNIDSSSWHAPSNMYTPFFAGIAAVYATHRDRKTSLNQARIRSIGSIIGGYFGMGIVYLIEYLFIELLKLDQSNYVLYYLVKYSIVSICIIPLIVLTIKLKQIDAVFITCVTFLSVTISQRNGGMPVFQFATNRVLSTLIGVGVALLVNNYLFIKRKTNKDVLFVSSLENNFLSQEDELSPFIKYKLNELFETNMPLMFATTRTPMAFESIFEDVNITYPMVTMNGAAKYKLKEKRYSDVHNIHKDSRIIIDEALNTLNMNAFVYTINEHVLHAYHNTLKNDGELKFYNHRKNQNAYSFVKGVLPDDLNPSLYVIIDCKENIDKFIKHCTSLNLFEKVSYVTYTYRKDINGKAYYYLRLFNKSVSKERYVLETMKDKNFNNLIVSVSGRTDLELIKHANLSMCLSIAPDYVKESVDIILNDDAGEALKIFDKIYHCTNIDKEILKIKRKYNKTGN